MIIVFQSFISDFSTFLGMNFRDKLSKGHSEIKSYVIAEVRNVLFEDIILGLLLLPPKIVPCLGCDLLVTTDIIDHVLNYDKSDVQLNFFLEFLWISVLNSFMPRNYKNKIRT